MTLQTYREYLRIRTELRELCHEAYNKNWEDQIEYISDNTKNSREFWNKMKLLKGKNAAHTNYMKDKDGNKFFTDKEKYYLMEQTWKVIFRITEAEENKFDKHHSDHINGYINVNHDRVNTYQAVDLNRLA